MVRQRKTSQYILRKKVPAEEPESAMENKGKERGKQTKGIPGMVPRSFVGRSFVGALLKQDFNPWGGVSKVLPLFRPPGEGKAIAGIKR